MSHMTRLRKVDIGRFNWAPEFMRLNGELLEAYACAKDSSEVVRIQNEYIESIKS